MTKCWQPGGHSRRPNRRARLRGERFEEPESNQLQPFLWKKKVPDQNLERVKKCICAVEIQMFRSKVFLECKKKYKRQFLDIF